ncbi:hypothetical protein M427DRAFT_354256 [Gonapodya prolifera JEL478]|uniref:Uncharacterized protein n=1 Tax=Gonapodya prolifera (strain JEL478) TaxID=1344416 RepID=A0A139ACC4_GONPJ|nr:hypothetical protein M427DRAFT_354256 [Gonapodya prolifera JEL478]|eukprot:KXS14073.1 hypothetical protein M427DRAFT_354256 [Gonapodya prolifera JEL478]
MDASGASISKSDDGKSLGGGQDVEKPAGPKRRCSIPLRIAITAMIFLDVAIIAISLTVVSVTSTRSSNADAITQGTKSITDLARVIQEGGASRSVWTQMDTYLNKIEQLARNTQGLVTRGVVKYDDFESMTLHMYTNLRAVDVTIQYYMYYMNDTQEMLGIGPVYPTTLSPTPSFYFSMYMTYNRTCATLCPNVTTNGRSVQYKLQESASGTLSINSLYSQSVPYLQLWKRPWYFDQLP